MSHPRAGNLSNPTRSPSTSAATPGCGALKSWPQRCIRERPTGHRPALARGGPQQVASGSSPQATERVSLQACPKREDYSPPRETRKRPVTWVGVPGFEPRTSSSRSFRSGPMSVHLCRSAASFGRLRLAVLGSGCCTCCCHSAAAGEPGPGPSTDLTAILRPVRVQSRVSVRTSREASRASVRATSKIPSVAVVFVSWCPAVPAWRAERAFKPVGSPHRGVEASSGTCTDVTVGPGH